MGSAQADSVDYEPVAEFCKLMLLAQDLDPADASEVVAGQLLALGSCLQHALRDSLEGVVAHSPEQNLVIERTPKGFFAKRAKKTTD